MENRQMKFPIASILFCVLSFINMIAIFTGNVATALFTTAACILLAISLFMKKRGVLMIIGTALTILSAMIIAGSMIINTVQALSYGYLPTSFMIHYILSCLGDLTSILLWTIILFMILALSEKLGAKLQKFAKKVWFIPVVLLFLIDSGLLLSITVAQVIEYGMYGDMILHLLATMIGSGFSITLQYVTWFLMLMWVSNPYRKEAVPAAQPAPVQSVENAVLAQPVEPVQPIQSVEPIEPVQPIESEEPAQSEEPIQQ